MTSHTSADDRATAGDGLSLGTRLADTLVPARRHVRGLALQNDRLESFLRSIPIDYCGWDQTGLQAMSAGFPELLGIARVTSIEDIQQALTPSDAASIATLYERLQQFGEHFEIGVHTATGLKSLKVYGKRGVIQAEARAKGGGADGAQVFSVLWILDISDFAQAAMRSIEAVAAVERRENEWRATLNALPFPMWVRDRELNIGWCNKFYARLVDDTAAAVVAEQKELPLTGVNKAGVSLRALAQRAVANTEPQNLRGHMIIEGQRRLVEIQEIPLGNDKRTIGLALDVTREEELETLQHRLAASHQETLEQMRTAIAMFDAETRLEFYNAAYEQLTGMVGTWMDARPRMVEVIDKLRELRKLPEQADYKQYKQQWAQRFTSLMAPSEDMQYLPDGTVLRQIVVPRPQGGVLVTLEDVTSRLQLETSYNTLIAVQQETMDNLAEGIAVFGEDGRLRLFNKSFARLWGLPADSLSGHPHVTLVADALKAHFSHDDWPAVRTDILTNGLERGVRRGRLTRVDGHVFEFAAVPLPDGNILNTYSDITDTLKVETALVEKNAALEAAEQLKTDFLANVSYQLRTPLNAIMGFAEMLDQQYFGPLTERQKEYTGSMISAGQRLVSLINDILDLSSLEAGYMTLYPERIVARTMLAQVADLTGSWAQKQGLHLAVDAPESMTLTADERRLKQVLLNLISNAINYSANGGTVTLSARLQGTDAVIAVSDNGLGIPAADLSRVFTPFEKITDGKTQRRSGAGLGLSLVKRIVELHGGRVTIESNEGKGTIVTCYLPQSDASGRS